MKRRWIALFIIIILILISVIIYTRCDDEQKHYIYFDGRVYLENKNDIVVFDANKFIDDVSKYHDYVWYFGDGKNSSGINVTHCYKYDDHTLRSIALSFYNNEGEKYLIDCGIIILMFNPSQTSEVASPAIIIESIDGIRLNKSGVLNDKIDLLKIKIYHICTRVPVDFKTIKIRISRKSELPIYIDDLIYNSNHCYYNQSDCSYYLFENNKCDNPDFADYENLLYRGGTATIYLNLTKNNIPLFPNTSFKLQINGEFWEYMETYRSFTTPESYDSEFVPIF